LVFAKRWQLEVEDEDHPLEEVGAHPCQEVVGAEADLIQGAEGAQEVHSQVGVGVVG
jgi:hypothetical protein